MDATTSSLIELLKKEAANLPPGQDKEKILAQIDDLDRFNSALAYTETTLEAMNCVVGKCDPGAIARTAVGATAGVGVTVLAAWACAATGPFYPACVVAAAIGADLIVEPAAEYAWDQGTTNIAKPFVFPWGSSDNDCISRYWRAYHQQYPVAGPTPPPPPTC